MRKMLYKFFGTEDVTRGGLISIVLLGVQAGEHLIHAGCLT